MKRIITLSIVISVIGFLYCGNKTFAQLSDSIYVNDSLIATFVAEVNVDSVESHIQFLEDMGTRFMIAPNRKTVAESIKEKFFSLGIQEVRIDSFYSTTVISYGNLQYDTTTIQYNVIATIPGIIDFDNFWVMGAHYDCVVAPNGDPEVFAPGADDNASGTAALFEVARIFSLHEYQPTNTIELVAFGAEELMYYGESGARAYVDTAIAHNFNMELMINNDMIAHTLTENWKVTISNYVDSEWLTGIAEQITNDYTSIEPLVRNLSDEAGADCKYFYEAGVPCVYFMEKDFNPYYHTDNDLLSNSDMDYCAETIKISVGVLLAAEDTTTTFLIDNDANRVLKLFPNPAKDIVTVAGLDKKKPIHFFIYDLNGRIMQSGTWQTGDENRLYINQLADGLYLIRFVLNNQSLQNSLLIKK